MTHRSSTASSTPRIAPKAVQAHLPQLAVLPFRDQTAEGPEAHLGEGLAEELLHAFNRVDGIRTLSRTSSFAFAGSALPPEVLGRQLGADHLLHGTLEARQGHLVLRAALLDVAAAQTRWQRDVTLERADLCTVLQGLIHEVADVLQVAEPKLPHHTMAVGVFESFLKGRQAYYRFNRQGMGEAREHFQAALALDPDCARVWAWLGLCAAYRYIYVERLEHHREEAAHASQRALERDDSLAEAHVSRGVALAASGCSEAADQAFEAALQRDPDLFEAYYFYARHCFATGRPMEAIQYFEWASVLRPEDYQALLIATQVYTSLGIEDEADACRQLGLERVEARLAVDPTDARAWYMGANALVGLGQREKGLEWARKARELDPGDPMLLYNLACIHALANDVESALDCLEQAVAAGLSEKAWILQDSDLQGLHDHGRFQELVRTL